MSQINNQYHLQGIAVTTRAADYTEQLGRNEYSTGYWYQQDRMHIFKTTY